MAKKVIFSGPPHGTLSAVLSKVAAVNKKSGPFSMLFVCGPVFGEHSSVHGREARLGTSTMHAQCAWIQIILLSSNIKGGSSVMPINANFLVVFFT